MAGVPFNSTVRVFQEYGGQLYIGGSFTNADSIAAADRIVRYDGVNFSALTATPPGTFTSGVFNMAVYDGDLFFAGLISNFAGVGSADSFVRYDGTNIVPVAASRLSLGGTFEVYNGELFFWKFLFYFNCKFKGVSSI